MSGWVFTTLGALRAFASVFISDYFIHGDIFVDKFLCDRDQWHSHGNAVSNRDNCIPGKHHGVESSSKFGHKLYRHGSLVIT